MSDVLRNNFCLVLGGSVYHISLLKALKKCKIPSIAVSYFENDPALEYADRSLNISSVDLPEIRSLFSQFKIDFVITTASDINTFTQAELNREFGLDGVIPQQVEQVSDKFKFNQLLDKLDLPTPYFKKIELTENILEEFNRFGRVIFKPIKGVRIKKHFF